MPDNPVACRKVREAELISRLETSSSLISWSSKSLQSKTKQVGIKTAPTSDAISMSSSRRELVMAVHAALH